MKINQFRYGSLLTVLLCSVFTLAAQAQVAVINTKKLLAALPEVRKADSLYNAQVRKYQTDYQLRFNATKATILFADSLNKVDAKAEAAVRATKIANEQLEQLKVLEAQSNTKITALRNQILTPHLNKVNAQIQAKVAEMKYKEVVDSQGTGSVGQGAGTDITDAIILALKNKNNHKRNW